MQTDLHRVIRTQHLTDDHCQVSSFPDLTVDQPLITRSPFAVLRVPDPPGSEINTQRWHCSPRPQACQLAA